MNKPDGHITTYTKVQFCPLHPHITDIEVRDIAHALSLMTRANGHFPRFYSVGQHSVDCAKEAIAEGLDRETILGCLLHDGSEAYLSDITRPVKQYLQQYGDIEKKMQDTIYEALLGHIPTEEQFAHIKRIDDMLLYYEFYQFMQEELYDKPDEPACMPEFSERQFREVEDEFLDIFDQYKNLSMHS